MGTHPSLSRNDEVIAKTHDLLRADQRLTIKEVSEELGISFGSC
jgi:DNA-binding Lrp family transcriptional regulator